MTLEIVAQSADDAEEAQRAGADRLELVSALSLGGLTPSIGTVEETRARCGLPAVAMLRPRSGGFSYSESELGAMERDAERFRSAGVQGLVFGALTPARSIDAAANRRLVAKGGTAVFHRAFDLLDEPLEAMERLIDLGFHRILTSGGRGSALEGIETIRRLVERSAGRIEILPGGGIRPDNVARIVRATGAAGVHLAGQAWVADLSGGRLPFNGPAHPEDRYGRVDGGIVSSVRGALALG